MRINKADVTNIIALSCTAGGYFIGNHMLFNIGAFALSGSVTNSLAIHMLFERVPFFYGSGVIEHRFEDFKSSIKSMLMEKFFTKENINNFTKDSATKDMDFSSIIMDTDFSNAFESLKNTVLESSFGPMLGMFGGANALDVLKEPFEAKLKTSIINITHTKHFQNSIKNILQSDELSDKLGKKIEDIIDNTLNQLEPKMVKNIISHMIREHLGWLVVWGGVFGGIIGLVGSFLV